MKKALIFIKSHLYNYWIATLALAMTNCKNTFFNMSLKGALIREAIQKKSIVKQKAFTLAEIMIVLSVIAVLTAILLPAARNAMPNENVLKFKKAHNALHTAISELVNSDKYYLNGDLGVKPDGTLIDGTHDGDNTYLCNTLADILNPKKVNCVSEARQAGQEGGWYRDGWGGHSSNAWWYDRYCRMYQTTKRRGIFPGEGIELSDGIVIYETQSNVVFGMPRVSLAGEGRLFLDDYRSKDENGFHQIYKIMCVDIDGISDDFSWTDYSYGTDYDETKICDGMCPFGYGVRHDGKIDLGLLAQEYLSKSIQEKD